MLVSKANIDLALEILTKDKDVIWSIDLETFCPVDNFAAITNKSKPLDKINSKIASLQISTPNGNNLYFNFAHKDGDLDYKYLKIIFDIKDTHKHLIAHNFNFEWTLLYLHGVDLSEFILWDTMIMGWLRDENAPQGLKPSIKKYFNYDMIKYKNVVGEGTMEMITGAEGYEYGMDDAIWTLKLFELYYKAIDVDYYLTFEEPVIKYIALHHIKGQLVDLKDLSDYALEDIEKSQRILNEFPVLKGVNLNSPKQVSNLLFNVLKLPVGKVSKKTGAPSTDKETLHNLILDYAETNPELKAFSEIRSIETRKKLYFKPYPLLVYPDGRWHSEIRHSGTVTGRFSMSSPNLQQMPKRGEGIRIRKVIIPEKEHEFIVSIDWSQIELRMAAHMSQDPKLLDAYRTGKDLHKVSGTNIMKCSYEEISERIAAGDKYAKSCRQKGKTLNFAALYLAGANRLSKFDLLNCTTAEAEEFLEAHKNGYSGYFHDFVNDTLREAREKLYVKTIFGRKRHLPNLTSPIKALKIDAEHQAVNARIQGSCGELMKLAFARLGDENLLYNDDVSFVTPIHDEFVFSMTREGVLKYLKPIKQIMEKTPKGFSVPVEAAASIGINFCDQVDIDDVDNLELYMEKALSFKSKGDWNELR